MSDNADPNVWGPPLWDLLFTFAYHIPPDAKRLIFRELFRDLERVLPCQHCRRSYAMYRQQVAPLTSLKDPALKPAAWLWTIHDMVNQNLGKIGISYEKLESRHAVFTCLTSPLSAVDLFCIMKPVIKHDHLVSFISSVLAAARHCPGMGELPRAFHTVGTDGTLPLDTDLTRALFDAHNYLRKVSYIPPSEDIQVFWQKYNPSS